MPMSLMLGYRMSPVRSRRASCCEGRTPPSRVLAAPRRQRGMVARRRERATERW
jgi:hypothetical protein